jgi:hypothetical protein
MIVALASGRCVRSSVAMLGFPPSAQDLAVSPYLTHLTMMPPTDVSRLPTLFADA